MGWRRGENEADETGKEEQKPKGETEPDDNKNLEPVAG